MKINILRILLLCTVTMFGQEFHGKAVYKTHRKIDLKFGNDSKGLNPAMQKQIQTRLTNQFQKTFILNFNKSESMYKEDNQLLFPQASSGGVDIQVIGNGGGTDILYKNTIKKRFSRKTEIGGKNFLIQDNLKDHGWKLSGESKNIGKYTCYKATRRVERTLLPSNTKDTEGDHKEKATMETIAWYTPEIPVSNGPDMFWGLPGLILEIQDGKLKIVCTEIILNPKKRIEIKEPRKGKKVTQLKFDNITQEYRKDMMERLKNTRNSKVWIIDQ